MIRKFFCGILMAASCAAALFADEEAIVWKFPAANAEWRQLHNSRVTENEQSITLTPLKGDHGIVNPRTDIDPKVYNCMRITYSASGFKTPISSGDLFFAPVGKKFSYTNRIHLPSLGLDGKNRTLTVRLDSPQWQNAGKITALRLDITDQMPGDVEIYKIEMLSRKGDLSDAVWDFADGAGCWDMNEKLDVTEENGELKLVTLGIDSHLFNYFDRFDASKYSQLQITYRASGFPKNRTTGGLFYMEKGDKNFTAKKFVRFPSLICDGNEHTLTVKVALKDIIALRLDIVDQTPGTVWLKKIAFLP